MDLLSLHPSRPTLKRNRWPRPRPHQTPRSSACKTLGMRTPFGPRFVALSRHSAPRLPWLRIRWRANTTSLPRPRGAALSKIGWFPSSASTAPSMGSRQTAARATADGHLRHPLACGPSALAPASPLSSRTLQLNGGARLPQICSKFASSAPMPACRALPTVALPMPHARQPGP